MLDPRLYIVIDTTLLVNGRDDRAASGLIQNGRRSGGQVCLEALFEVEGELGVCEQVGIPIAAARGSPLASAHGLSNRAGRRRKRR